MSNLVPDGWERCVIGKKFKFLGGYAFKSLDSVDSGTRWLKIANVGIGKIKWEDRSFLPSSFIKEHPNYVLNQGDCVVALTRPIIRGELKVAKIRSFDSPSLLNQRVAKVKFNNDLIDNDFVHSMMRYEEISREIEITIFGTDPPNLSTKQIEEIKFNFPPIPEQQKIAKILTSVDEVIEKTQAQIDKLKDLKTGMMQELLTNGIGHTEFKDSPVGRIPAEWEVGKFGDITLEHKQGFYSKDKYTADGTYLIRITDMQNPYISFTEMPKMVISDKDKEAYKVLNGDFLFARSGAIGRYGIFDSSNEAVFASYLIRFRFNLENALNEFVGFWYESDVCQKQLGTITQGSSNININAQNIKELRIPVPPIDEQKKITQAILSIVKKIICNERKLTSLKNTKKALMQDLLTGKVRVKVDS